MSPSGLISAGKVALLQLSESGAPFPGTSSRAKDYVQVDASLLALNLSAIVVFLVERRLAVGALARLALSIAAVLVLKAHTLGEFVGRDKGDVGTGPLSGRWRIAECRLDERAILRIRAAWASLKVGDGTNKRTGMGV